MGRETNRLTSRGVSAIRTPGMHADGAGLYLRVDQGGARSWVLIFHQRGRRREMGLGPLAEVGLADARAAAADAQELVRKGLDPIALRKAAKAPPKGQTFEGVASEMLDELEKGWKSPKQRPQWEASLQQHAAAIWKADVARSTLTWCWTASNRSGRSCPRRRGESGGGSSGFSTQRR